jgi:hypothetical protein
MQYRIRCTLPNASDNINGIPFSPEDGAMVAEIDDAAAADNFASIPGYEVEQTTAGGKKSAEKEVKPIADMGVAEIKALLAEHPSAWGDVEAAEMAREEPRKGVITLLADLRDAEDDSPAISTHHTIPE